MAIAELTGQRGTSGGPASTTSTATYLSTPTEGNLLVAMVNVRGNVTPSALPSGWAQAAWANGSSNDTYVFWKIAGASESLTHTWTWSGSFKTAMVWSEWSGIDTTSPVDKTNTGTATSGTASTGATGVLAQAEELVIAAFGGDTNGTFSGYTSGYGEIGQVSTTGGKTSTRNTGAMASRIVSATTTQTVTASWSASTSVWSAAVVTFKAPAAATPITGTDSTQISSSETSSFAQVNFTRTDSTQISSSETSSFAQVNFTRTDTTNISSTETSSIFKTSSTTDSTQISSTDSGSVFPVESFTPVLDSYRWYDGSTGQTESGSTPLQAQDTMLATAFSGTQDRQLRVRIQETGGGSGATTDDWTLEYSVDGGSWKSSNILNEIYSANSSTLVEGNPTTNRLTGGTGSFVAGKIVENTGQATDLQLTANNFTEILFNTRTLSSLSTAGVTISLRVLLNGVPITQSITPQIRRTVPAVDSTLISSSETSSFAQVDFTRTDTTDISSSETSDVVPSIPSASIIVSEDFEGGSADATITSSNTTFDIDNGAGTSFTKTIRTSPTPVSGTKVGEWATTAATNVSKDTGSLPGTANGGTAEKVLYFRGYLRGTIVSAANRTILFEGSVAEGGTDVAVMRLHPEDNGDNTGNWRLGDGTSFQGTGTTHGISNTEWTRVEWMIDQNTDTQELRLWWGADVHNPSTSATNYESTTHTVTLNTDMEVWGIGQFNTITHTLYADALAVASGGWIGPIATDAAEYEFFLEGSNGAAVGTTDGIFDDGSESGTGPTYTNSQQVVPGQLSVYNPGASTDTWERIVNIGDNASEPRTTVHLSAFLYIPTFTVDSSFTTIYFARNTVTQMAAQLGIRQSTGTLATRDAASGVSTGITFPKDAWFRVDWKLDFTANTQYVDIFTGSNIFGTTADDSETNDLTAREDASVIYMGKNGTGGQDIPAYYGPFAYRTDDYPDPLIVAKSATDTTLVSSSESRSFATVARSATDTTQISSSETSSVLVTISATDATQVSSSETSSFATVARSATDTTLISSSETSSILVTTTRTDTTDIGSSETSSSQSTLSGSDTTLIASGGASFSDDASTDTNWNDTGVWLHNNINWNSPTEDWVRGGSTSAPATRAVYVGEEFTSPNFVQFREAYSPSTNNYSIAVIASDLPVDSASVPSTPHLYVLKTTSSVRLFKQGGVAVTTNTVHGYGTTPTTMRVEWDRDNLTVDVYLEGSHLVQWNITGGDVPSTGNYTGFGIDGGFVHIDDFVSGVVGGGNIETAEIVSSQTQTDTTQIGSSETSSILSTLTRADSTQITSSETSSFATVAFTRTDTTDISSSENSLRQASFPGTDSTIISSSETSNVVVGGGIDASANDTTGISSSETSSVLVTISASDATLISSSENRSFATSTFTATDSTSISSSETSSKYVSFSATDTTLISSSETSSFGTVLVPDPSVDFYDDFERSDGSIGNGWTGGSILSGDQTGVSTHSIYPTSVTRATAIIGATSSYYNLGIKLLSSSGAYFEFTVANGEGISGAMVLIDSQIPDGGNSAPLINITDTDLSDGGVLVVEVDPYNYYNVYLNGTFIGGIPNLGTGVGGNGPAAYNSGDLYDTIRLVANPGGFDSISVVSLDGAARENVIISSSETSSVAVAISTSDSTNISSSESSAFSTVSRSANDATLISSSELSSFGQVNFTRTDTTLISSSENSYTTPAFPGTDTTQIDSSESSSIQISGQFDLSATDTTAINSSETSSVLVTISASDTTNISSSEARSFGQVNFTRTDSTLISSSESSTSSSTLAGADTTLISSSEASFFGQVNFSRTDTTLISSSESSINNSTLAASDTTLVSSSEVSSFGTVARSANDTTQISSSEAVSFATVSITGTDATQISSSETSNVVIDFPGSDATQIGSSESSNVVISGGSDITSSDTTSISSSDSSTPFVMISVSDSTNISSSESVTFPTITFTRSDSTLIGSSETNTINVSVPATDTTQITSTDSSSFATVARSATDTTQISSSESSAFATVSRSASDTTEISSTEAGSFGTISFARTDTTSISSSENSYTTTDFPGGDTTQIDSFETSSIQVGGGINVSATDTTDIGSSDTTQSIVVAVSGTDSTLLGASEASSFGSVNFTRTDTTQISSSETSTFGTVARAASDSTLISSTESSSFATVARSASDTTSISSSESTSFGQVNFTSTDSTLISSTEVSYTTIDFPGGDTTILGSSESSSVNISGGADISGSDSTAISSSEASYLVIATDVSANDTTNISSSETVSVAATMSASDTTSVGSTENRSFAQVNFVRTDTTEISSSENSSPAAQQPGLDSTQIDSSESSSIQVSGSISISGSDSTNINSSETTALSIGLTRSDTTQISSSESVTFGQVNFSATDSTQISSTETGSFGTITRSGSDSTEISSAEQSSTSLVFPGTDATAISSTESSAVVVTGTIPKGASDSTNIGSSEASSTSISLARTDATSISSSESVSISATMTAIDTTSIGSIEAGYFSGISLPDTDATEIGSTETSSVQIITIITASDNTEISSSETSSTGQFTGGEVTANTATSSPEKGVHGNGNTRAHIDTDSSTSRGVTSKGGGGPGVTARGSTGGGVSAS